MTFLNVLIITLIFVICYALIRYLTVIRPLQKISRHLDQIASGDFSNRIDDSISYGNFLPVVRKINRMTGYLESSAVMKTDFVSNISHEMKTPIAVIQNYGALLKSKGIDEDERLEYADGIMHAAGRMNELITNILRLNRLETHQINAQKQLFDLSEQLSECILQFENVWEEKKIDLDLEIPDEMIINSDAELLSLVWNNLLSNAFKFTDTGGTVSVLLTKDSDMAVVKIIDTGCGIDAETGKHIFEKFYQGDTSHAAQGNGLGLALVRRVIDIIQGEIYVDSTPGEGTAFTVRVPVD